MCERALQETAIIDTVKDIRMHAPGIGAYKLYLMLKDVYGSTMYGRDRFYKLMHKYHLMLTAPKRRHTTNSDHPYRKYKNLIKGFVPTAPGQLWVADITYIDTDEGVCYLHLLTDAFTHEIIGWTLSDTLMAIHTLEALEQGIKQADQTGLASLIHHSDRGVQYCCNMYINRLKEISALVSMTEDSNPTDNAIAERVNGIIKQEWLYRMKRPKDIKDAQRILADIVDFYNNKRPHMSNGMQTPAQVRRIHTAQSSLEASRLQPRGKPPWCFS